MKLVYWSARRMNDNRCYNIRERTKKEAERKRNELVTQGFSFGPVAKVEVEYQDGFDLLDQCLGEETPEWSLPYPPRE